MKVRITTLHRHDDLEETFREDDWLIVPPGKMNELYASHPEAGDETTARIRLHTLGLLTSGSLRIEFSPPCTGKIRAARQQGQTSLGGPNPAGQSASPLKSSGVGCSTAS